jgi:hypothetical protein
VNLFHRASRAIVAAFLTIGVLLGSNGPRAAHALPIDPTDTCLPQPVTTADAELLGTLRLLDAAVVGYDTRISMQAPSVRIPDPKCDGRYITVPLVYSWDVLSRPAGSTALVTQTTTLIAHLTPDIAGDWQIAFTACPAGCKVTGTTITIGPLRRTINFSSTVGIEGRLSSDFFNGTLNLFLNDSRVQISNTGSGGFVSGTPYDVTSYPLTAQYQRHCLDVPDPPADCDEMLESMISHATVHTITPSFSSFIDFGPTAEAQGAPAFILLPVEPHEHDVPTWKRAVFVGLQSLFLGTSIDIDRARLLANNIHLDLKNLNMWDGTIGGGSLNLQLKFDSDHPTIKCEAHYTQRIGFIFSASSGWADELCPDYDLSQMEMTIHVFPTVVNDAITVGGITVEVQLTPQGLQSDLIDYFTDVSAEQEIKIAEKVRNRLIEPENKARLGAVLMKVLQHRFPDLVRVQSSQLSGSDWVVRYERN